MNTANRNNIVDIDLSVIKKQKFRIDGDDSRILELDTSDLGVLTRLNEAYPKLKNLESEMTELSEKTAEYSEKYHVDEESEDSMPEIDAERLAAMDDIAGRLKSIDTKIREQMDYIFDAPVSSVCAPSGTMYDIVGGHYRYEHILDVISGLYESNIAQENKKMLDRINKHTAKYGKGKK